MKRSSHIVVNCLSLLALCVLLITLTLQLKPVEAVFSYYDDASGSVNYSGDWTHSTGWPKAYNSTVSWAYGGGNNTSLTFNGSSITRVYNMAYNRGLETVDVIENKVFRSSSQAALAVIDTQIVQAGR